MVLTELLPTACAVTLLPVLRMTEPVVVPVAVMANWTPVAVAVTTPAFDWRLDTALDGRPAPKVDMLRLFTAELP